MATLDQIALLRAERGLVAGGTNSGKSTLAERLFLDFGDRYPDGRVMVLDSKPRFRASHHADGRSTRRQYRHWDHGPTVPNSVRVTEPDDLDLVWGLGYRFAIVQSDGSITDRPWMVECAARFLAEARTSRPQLIYVDETLDFFTRQGSPVKGSADTLLQVVRAGRERGCGALFASQRTMGIPPQLISELTKLYLFRLDFRRDAERLMEAGAPPEIVERQPHEDREFVYWDKNNRRVISGPYRLSLPNTKDRVTA